MEQKYGEWTIIKEVDRDETNGLRRFLCRCSCGKESIVRYDKLKNGQSKSCESCGHRNQGLKMTFSGKTRSPSGVRGVHWNKKDKMWEANITHKRVRYYLGQYDDKNDAIQARLNAEEDLKRELKLTE